MSEGLTKSGYVQTGLTAPKHRRTCCAHGENSAPLPLWRHPTQPVRHDPFNTARHYGPFNTSRSARPSSQVPRAVASPSARSVRYYASLGLHLAFLASRGHCRRPRWQPLADGSGALARTASILTYGPIEERTVRHCREGFDAVADWGRSRGQGPRRVPQPPRIGHRPSSNATPFPCCGGQLEEAIVR